MSPKHMKNRLYPYAWVFKEPDTFLDAAQNKNLSPEVLAVDIRIATWRNVIYYSISRYNIYMQALSILISQ